MLNKVYRIERAAIKRLIEIVLADRNSTIPGRLVVTESIQVYGETKFDFVDCLMVGYAKHEGHEIVTFDKKLKKYLDDSQAS